MALTSKMSVLLGSCLIFLALTAISKNDLIEAVPLQGCQTKDIDLLLVVDDTYVPSYIQQMFISDILEYFLAPDDDLMSKIRIAMASASLYGSLNPLSFPVPSANTISDAVQNLTEKPRLTFQMYNSTDDVERQLNLVYELYDHRLYVNHTLNNTACNPNDLLEQLKQNSSHVGLAIVGHIWSHVIERISYKDGLSGVGEGSCNVELFFILVGNDVKDQVLLKTEQVKTQFYLPSLDFHRSLSLELCRYCRPEPLKIYDYYKVLEDNCYFLYTSDSPITWLEASNQCKKQDGHLVSLESEEELGFVRFILNNYAEKEFLQTDTGPTVDVENEYDKKVYIGLVRSNTRIGSPFLWVSDNPLIYTNWVNGLPDGGPNERCGLWLFMRNVDWSESLGRTVYNSSDLKMNYNGWEDIGCGSRVTSIALCEAFARDYWRPVHHLKSGGLNVLPANMDSFTSAISRGEFSNFKNEIVSIPAFVRDSKFVSFLKESGESFNVFSCENEVGEMTTIPYSYVCDHIEHCYSRQDESISPVLWKTSVSFFDHFSGETKN